MIFEIATYRESIEDDNYYNAVKDAMPNLGRKLQPPMHLTAKKGDHHGN